MVRKFHEIRVNTLILWQEMTGRECLQFYDDIGGAYECKWQGDGDPHVSIFCSLGVWSACLSQLLQDKRYDEIIITDEFKAGNELYSYYNQVLLIASEILDDLVNMYTFSTTINGRSTTKAKAKIELTGSRGYPLSELVAFINNIVKHKAANFHKCNHHLPVYFEDARQRRKAHRRISIGAINDLHQKDSLLIPSLPKIIVSIVLAYRGIDRVFSTNPAAYDMIVSEYGENQ